MRKGPIPYLLHLLQTSPLYNVGELLNVGFGVQDLFVQVTVVVHLKSILPRRNRHQIATL